MKNTLLSILLFSLSSTNVAANSNMTCEEAKAHTPELTIKQRLAVKKFYRNEKRHVSARGGSYRSEEEIASLFRKIQKIEILSKSCNIPIGEISLQRYFELTGEEF